MTTASAVPDRSEGDGLLRRRLLAELIRRDLRGRFAGARFGLLWSLINPMVQLVSYGLIFGYFFGRGADGDVTVLVASLFAGLWPWWAFHESTLRGLSSIVEQSALLKKVPIPPALCVVAAVTSAYVLQMVGLALFLGCFAVAGVVTPHSGWIFLPMVALAEYALILGVAFVLAPIYVVVRDTIHVVNALLTVGFFASPVLYRLGDLPGWLQLPGSLNPMVAIIGAYRMLILGEGMPPAASIGSVVCLTLAGLSLGYWLTHRASAVLDEYW